MLNSGRGVYASHHLSMVGICIAAAGLGKSCPYMLLYSSEGKGTVHRPLTEKQRNKMKKEKDPEAWKPLLKTSVRHLPLA